MLMMAVSFASCEKEKEERDPLVGTWVEKTTIMPYTLELRGDYTGSLSYDTSARALLTDNFNWSATSAGGENYLNVIHTGGDLLIYKVLNPYVLAGNELIVILTDSDGDSYQVNFRRK